MNDLVRVESLRLVKAAHPLTVQATVSLQQPRGAKEYSCRLLCDETRLPSPFAVSWQIGGVPRRYRCRVMGRVYDAVLCGMQEGGARQ